MNETIEQVTAVIIENRRRFKDFCFSLTEEQLARPVPGSEWIVQDFASHLATLDATFMDFLGVVERGGEIDMGRDGEGAPFDLDAWNDEQVAERRSWPIARIFKEAAGNREQMIEALGRLDEEQISRTMHFKDPKRGAADFPLKAFLVGWGQHDPIHAADMAKALPELGDDADLKAWFANPFVAGYQAAMNR